MRRVVIRAHSRCEYCRLPQIALDLNFHVEHITAKQHGGDDEAANLCLACDRCNLHKGTNLTAIDPQSEAIFPLFHPRRDEWETHFVLEGSLIVGMTPIGRATVRLLQMNSARRRTLRQRLLAEGRW